MSYAILRTKKLKEWGNICASLEHNFRERLTPNADSNRTPENVHIGANSTEEVRQKIEQSLPEKFRADCVKCIEYLITASPEFFKERSSEVQQKYFDNAIEWLKERHGADNVKCISIHRDESTPHLVAYVGDKINALFDFKNAELNKMRKTIQSLNEDVERAKRDGYLQNYRLIQRNNALEKELNEYKLNHRLNTENLSEAQINAFKGLIERQKAENEKERLEYIQQRSLGGGLSLK